MTGRYYVLESTGYLINGGAAQAGNCNTTTEVLVLDRDYCHRVCWSSLWGGKHWYSRRLPALRDEAAELCRTWNMEDCADVA